MPAIPFKRALVVDDEENIRHLLQVVLSNEGLEVMLASSADEALAAVSTNRFDVMLSDIRMPGMSGIELLKRIRSSQADLVTVMMSAYGSVDSVVEAIKEGACDYIAKPFKPAEVMLVLRKAEEREGLKRENQRLRSDLEQVKQASGLGAMIGHSDAMQRLFQTIRKIASYKTTVLISGESGTGKELVAQALHDLGASEEGAARPFVPVNCGAIPENLLESELFGHRKGAFTDATFDKKGLFAEADGGTIFLDEIGELPLSLQVKLLRVLQEEEIRPVGDTKGTKVDTRVVAATVKDLHHEVKEGRFREDLYYRLNVLPLKLPPLRERLKDIPHLVQHFIARYNRKLAMEMTGVEPDALKGLMAYQWPGNVRELENTIEHAMVLSESKTIEAATLPAKVFENADPVQDVLRSEDLSIKRATRLIERELIRKALRRTRGNRTGAARMLEISHRALLYKIKEYGLTDV